MKEDGGHLVWQVVSSCAADVLGSLTPYSHCAVKEPGCYYRLQNEIGQLIAKAKLYLPFRAWRRLSMLLLPLDGTTVILYIYLDQSAFTNSSKCCSMCSNWYKEA